ncbi:MAG: hypothetical protein K1000chlam4_00210 [Chlamydiae bacterium]|nr:hypothetical protein [Chlamydiota bacterium]
MSALVGEVRGNIFGRIEELEGMIGELETETQVCAEHLELNDKNLAECSAAFDVVQQEFRQSAGQLLRPIISVNSEADGVHQSLQLIFANLSPSELSTASRVCRNWFKAASTIEVQSLVWAHHLRDRAPTVYSRLSLLPERTWMAVTGKNNERLRLCEERLVKLEEGKENVRTALKVVHVLTIILAFGSLNSI